MICRLCLMNLNSENSIVLFNVFGSNADAELLNIIEKYLHLDITWNDEISNIICQNCSKCLIEFDKYCAYIKEQQIMLSQRVPVVIDHIDAENVDTKNNIVPVLVDVKNEPVIDVAIEKNIKCETEKDVTEEDVLRMEAQLKCEPEEADFTEMTVMSSTVSNDSANKDWSFNENLERRNIEDSSTSSCFMSDKQVQFIPDPISIKLLQPIQEIYKNFLLGNPLEDNDRTIIAEAVIEECLDNKPEKVLKCTEFAKLADNIIEVFPSDHVTTYYLWPTSRRPASGKLFFAYNRQLISSVKTKVKRKYNTKKIAMTSTERSRKYRAKKCKVNHKDNSNIRIYSAVIDETLAVENVDTEDVPVQSTAEDDIVAREMQSKYLSEDDILTRTKTKMKTKTKPMTSAERTRKHRARKDPVNHMKDVNISSAAGMDEYLAADTQSVESVTNNMAEDGTMQTPPKYLSEKEVRTKTSKTKTKKKAMTATERSRIYRARKYHIHNLENMKISSSASIDGTLESVVQAAWY